LVPVLPPPHPPRDFPGACAARCLHLAFCAPAGRTGGSILSAMEVKNTFIDMPATPGGLGSPVPTPMASAPAKGYFSVKDSLAEAAVSEDFATLTASAVKTNARAARIPRGIPNQLDFMSTQSMMSIPESPMYQQMGLNGMLSPKLGLLGQPVTVRKGSTFSAAGSIPPTPIGMMDYGSTPTSNMPQYGGYTTMLPPAMPMSPVGAPVTMTVAGPPIQQQPAAAAASRQTLSLVDMISPKGIAAGTMLQPAFTGYQTMVGALPPPPQYQPAIMVQPTVMQVAQPPVAAPSAVMAPSFPAPVGAPTLPPSFPAPTASMVFAKPPQDLSPPAGNAGAAVALGLMCAPPARLQVPTPTHMGIGTLPVQYAAPAPAIMQSAPIMQNAAPTVYMSASGPAPMATVINQRMIPPPPLSAAPMAVFSPQGNGPPVGVPMCQTPTSPENDMKVLLDMAVASGNQKAVDALLRQAQQSGVRVMMPPPVDAAQTLSTSPVSR